MSITTNEKLTINPETNEWAQVRFFKNREDYRPFSPCGPIHHKDSYYKETHLDSWDRIILLPKAGRYLFREIKNNRSIDLNISTMNNWQDADQSHYRFICRGLKDLLEANIIAKAKPIKEYLFKPEQHTYMINPYLIKCLSYKKARIFWQLFTGQKKEFEK